MGEGNNNASGDAAMPDDVVLVKQTGGLEFYFSQSEHSLFVRISGCPAGPIRLSRSELTGLLHIFDQQTQEKETRLLAELDDDDDDF